MKEAEIILRLIKQLVVLTNFTVNDLEKIEKLSLRPSYGQVSLKQITESTFTEFRESFAAPLGMQCMPFGYRDFFHTRVPKLFKQDFLKIQKYFSENKIDSIIELNTQIANLEQAPTREQQQQFRSERNKLLVEKCSLIAEKIKLTSLANEPRSLKELAVFSLYKSNFFKVNPKKRELLPIDLQEYVDEFAERIDFPKLPQFFAIYLLPFLLTMPDIDARGQIYPFNLIKLIVSYDFLDQENCEFFSEHELSQTALNETPGILTTLHIACICNDELSTRILLEKKLPHEKFFWLYPLHWAAQLGYANIVTLLLEHGADINAKGFNGLTPLHLAVRYGHEITARILIEKGANVKASDDQNRTIFYMACVGNNLRLVEFLASVEGVDINAKTARGLTCVHAAALNGRLDILKFLVQEQQLEPHILDQSQKTPLDLASQYILDAKQLSDDISVHSNFDVVKWFVENEYIKPDHNNYKNILKTSLIHRDINFILMLLKDEKVFSEAVLTSPFDQPDETILYYACQYGCEAVIFYLIETREDFVKRIINLRDEKNGDTVLHLVASKNNQKLYRLLITMGADPDFGNDKGMTPALLLAKTSAEAADNVADNINGEDAEGPAPMQLS